MLDPSPSSAGPAGRSLKDQIDTSSGGRREFNFDRKHFDFIAGLLYKLAGISLAPHKIEMMYSRLARRLRELNIKDFDTYCALVDSENGEPEIRFLVNALTTNLTSFFREQHHFEHLAKTTLAAVKTSQSSSSKPRLRIWSAGCSSGPEPYTIAMVLCANIPDIRRWDAKILATDIDTHMVDTARRGICAAESAKTIPSDLRDRFTKRVRDGAEPEIAMVDELRRLITFKPLNLLEPWPMKGPFDAIFCRNVLIYFDRPGRTTVIDKFSIPCSPQNPKILWRNNSKVI